MPAANLLGEEGGGFVALMQNLPRERIAIGVTALAGAEQAFADTLAYCKQRSAFGQPIGKFQHNRFALAEMATEIAVARDVHRPAPSPSTAPAGSPTRRPPWSSGGTPSCATGSSTAASSCTAATATCASTPWPGRSTDSRVQTIFGGTTEIMKEIIGRGLGL